MLIIDMKTINELYEKFGGSGAVARAIRVKPSAASEMRRRKSIPVRYWPLLIEQAAMAGMLLDNDMLVQMHVAQIADAAA